MNAQAALFWVVFSIAIVGFVAALLWQWKRNTEHDWVEHAIKALFVAMQLTIWGNVVGFILLSTWGGFNFGGMK